MGELNPRMRAGDVDRQRVVEQLGKHFGEGRLTLEEFDERVVRAHGAVYLDELPTLTADLPRETRPAPRQRQARPPAWLPPAAVVLLMAMLVTWAVAEEAHGGPPPIFAFLLLVLLLRHRRWSRRW